MKEAKIKALVDVTAEVLRSMYIAAKALPNETLTLTARDIRKIAQELCGVDLEENKNEQGKRD